MAIFIRSTSGISPGSLPGSTVSPTAPSPMQGRRLKAIEPDYAPYFDTKQIRRTSRIVRMGVAAALDCLRIAGSVMPDAIVTGTAFGCLEDTGVFLDRLISQQEQMLSPTAFIQSTHNTIGAQIALLLQCMGYNNTFVHRSLSFESALLDAWLLLADNEAGTVLAGGLDELTPTSHAILQRFGLCRHHSVGEGAFFFLLTTAPSADNWARLDGLNTFFGDESLATILARIDDFLATHQVPMDEIDLVLWGADEIPTAFASGRVRQFKPFSGEFPTASAFALGWAISEIKNASARRVLVYNSSPSLHHSLILVSNAAQ